LYDALEQAESNLIDNTRPVAIYKQDRKEPIAVLYAKDFLELTYMSEQADEEMSFPIEVPNNTLGIFVSCEPGSQNIVLHSYEFVDDSARVDKRIRCYGCSVHSDLSRLSVRLLIHSLRK
jgi:hypothetical protein